jgi:mxaJ protein
MSSGSSLVREAIRDIVVVAALSGAVSGVVAFRNAQAAVAAGSKDAPVTHIVVPAATPTPVAPDPGVLRVCADPNNLPFTNEKQEGMENGIAAIAARDLGRRLEYYWQPERRGFMRTTLKAGRCDVVMGVPSTFELALTTIPYYRSTYVFVTRRDRLPGLKSFDDPRLRQARIGIQITGEDYENPPPAHALASRRLFDNVRGFTVYGDYSKPDPQRTIIDAVAAGGIDAAVVWGPLAFFAAREAVPLAVRPVTPSSDGRTVPFVFDISMGVRRGDTALRDALNRTIARRRAEIRRVLQAFHVPLAGTPAAAAAPQAHRETGGQP